MRISDWSSDVCSSDLGLALRHVVHPQMQADAALRRHFDRRAGQPRGAHVLDRDDRVRRHQFEAGLDQQFFGEGVADLHRRALFLGILAEVRSEEHTSELQSLMRISYAVFCLTKKTTPQSRTESRQITTTTL